MYADTHNRLVSGAGGKCRPASSLIALPVMRDGAIDQDLLEEQNTHTEYCPLSRLWRDDGAIFGTLSLKLCMLTENKSFKFLNVSYTNTLPTADTDSSYNTDTLRQNRHSHSSLTL